MRVVGGGEAGKRRGRAVEHFLAALDVDEGVGLGLLGKKTRELVLDILCCHRRSVMELDIVLELERVCEAIV